VVWALSPVVKYPGHEDDNSPPSHAKLSIMKRYLHFPVCLQSMLHKHIDVFIKSFHAQSLQATTQPPQIPVKVCKLVDSTENSILTKFQHPMSCSFCGSPVCQLFNWVQNNIKNMNSWVCHWTGNHRTRKAFIEKKFSSQTNTWNF
jgi:hypothetical protein